MALIIHPTENQEVALPFKNDIRLYIKREDKIHAQISGNKYRKLKYNLQEAQNQGFDTLLSFGGAYSNHIAAVAAAGQICQMKTIGVIRGDELASKVVENPTLRSAVSCKMQLHFVSREAYRQKNTESFRDELRALFGNFYEVPEGGTNALAVQGCQEILTPDDAVFDFITTAVGTAGTISGIIRSTHQHQKVLGFPALKGDFLSKEIEKYTQKTNWKLINEYHFSGYAKYNQKLIDFLNNFYLKTKIPLDPIYTGKMMYGIFDLIEKDFFPEKSKILAIHTGGLQGILGFNQRLQKHLQKGLIYEDEIF